MKILKGKVEWWVGWLNYPEIHLLVDRVPTLEEFTYQEHDGIWFAELEGFISFFSWKGPDNQGGYGSREFPINTDKGRVVLKGPWSSAASYINFLGLGSGPVIDASVTDSPAAYERGHTFYSQSVLVNRVEDYLKTSGLGVELQRFELWDEGIIYLPTLIGKGWEESKKFLEDSHDKN